MRPDEDEAAEVLRFWFEELGPDDWFGGSPELDARIRERFGALHEALGTAPLPPAETSPRHVLAAIIVLDQFSRNIHRRTAAAFASDDKARAAARALVDTGADRLLSEQERTFAYMPFMHSEELADHHLGVALYEAMPGNRSLGFARQHLEIIERFGRYPHRNEALGRESTPEELAYLQKGARFGQ